MPNHCTNYLSCTSGKSIGELIKPYISYKDEHGEKHPYIDFNKIVPMPECILETLNFGSMEYIQAKRTPEEEEIEKKKREELNDRCMKETGHSSWYDWSVANWDTKWNSYNNTTLEEDIYEDQKMEDLDSLTFQTAWSPPINVIRRLAKLTGESLRMSYYDEGWMFAGEYLVNADGSETDNCYDDMDQIPESSELYYECDLPYYYELKEEQEEEEDEE